MTQYKDKDKVKVITGPQYGSIGIVLTKASVGMFDEVGDDRYLVMLKTGPRAGRDRWFLAEQLEAFSEV